ncbi:hypothetical protein HKD37_16G045776 [Glycine soja]
MKRHEFLWESYTTTVMSALPPISLVGIVAWCAVEGLLSFNFDYMVWYRRKTKMFIDPKNANTTTLAEVAETLQYMVSPQGRNTWTIDDLVPYMEKITILSEEQERITEAVAHGPAS